MKKSINLEKLSDKELLEKYFVLAWRMGKNEI